MPDDKQKTQPQDAKRINLQEDYEVRDWCNKLGCSKQELEKAVQEVGTSADKVKEYLKKAK